MRSGLAGEMAFGPGETQSDGHKQVGVVRFGIPDAMRLAGQKAREAWVAAGEALAQIRLGQASVSWRERLIDGPSLGKRSNLTYGILAK